MPDENSRHADLTYGVKRACNRCINHTRDGGQTDINVTVGEIANTIADEVMEATGLRCETFANDYGNAVIISDYTNLIARIVPDCDGIQVVAAPLDLEAVVTSIPSKATSLNGMRELTAQLDDAIAHVTAAAVAAVRQ